MTKVDGIPLSELGKEFDAITRRHLYRQIGSLLEAIHRIPRRRECDCRGSLLDLAKTDCYSIRGDAATLDGLTAGYDALPVDGGNRMRLYRRYHALELWDWFGLIGQHQHLAGIAEDMARLARSVGAG